MVILFYEVLQYEAVVCGERAVCCVEAGGPDSQLRSEDERKETAGEECTFRDGWAHGWKAFSNCANFRPHMSVNLPKPVHSVSPLASIKPPLWARVWVNVYVYVSVGVLGGGGSSLFAQNQRECTNKQPKRGAKSFATLTNLVAVSKFYFLSRSLLFQFPVPRGEFKSSHTHSWKCEQNVACAHQDMTCRPRFRCQDRLPFPSAGEKSTRPINLNAELVLVQWESIKMSIIRGMIWEGDLCVCVCVCMCLVERHVDVPSCLAECIFYTFECLPPWCEAHTNTSTY